MSEGRRWMDGNIRLLFLEGGVWMCIFFGFLRGVVLGMRRSSNITNNKL